MVVKSSLERELPSDAVSIPLPELLRECANGLQAASNYMEAARFPVGAVSAALSADPALVEKGAAQLARAADAYHRLCASIAVACSDC